MSNRRRLVSTALSLGISAASLAVLLASSLASFDSEAAEGAVVVVESEDASVSASAVEPTGEVGSKRDAQPRAKAQAKQGQRQQAKSAAVDAVAGSDAAEAAIDPGEQVAVPNVAGMRLWIARKRLSDAGLVLAPREGKRVIPTDEYPDYQVDSSASFGQMVPAGSKILVNVEYWSPAFAGGY